MMTLSQAERLVRRIDELIGQPGLEAQAPKLAQDYADLGRAASRRLEQCVAMIENGQDLQALQLAETQPPLLDLLTLLDFRQAKEWRGWCQQHNLPWVEPFYDKHVRTLNATYGKGITSDHAFYRDYRREHMKGNDQAALAILRVIVRLNPGDKNWAAELHRVEGKLVQAAMEELRQILATGDFAGAMAKLAQLEAAALPIPANHPVWLQVQVRRCQNLLTQAEALRERDAWAEAATVVEDVRVLANQNNVPLNEADTQRWNELDAWTSGRRAVVVQEQDFQRAVTALQYQIETSENKQAAAGGLTVEQLQGELNLLAGKVQDAERFGRSLDPDLDRRYELVCARLRGRIQKRLKGRKMGFAMAVVIGLAVVAVAALTFWVFSQQKDTVAQLNQRVAGRDVSGTTNLLGQIPKSIPPPYKPSAALAAAMAKAETFVAEEEARKRDFDQKLQGLANLAGNGFTSPWDQINDQISACEQALEKVAPEFKTEGESKLEPLKQLWQTHLDSLKARYNADFGKLLDRAETFASTRLGLVNGFDAVLAAIPQEQNLLTNLDDRLRGPIAIQSDLTSRYHDLTNRFSLWVAATRQVRTAHDVDDYMAGLQELSQCPLAAEQQDAITKVRAWKHSPAQILGALLMPEHPDFWDTLATAAAAAPRFKPDQPNDAEKEAYFKLANDKLVQNVYYYKLEKNNRPDNPKTSHYIFSEGSLSTNRLGHLRGIVYDPSDHPGELDFQSQEFDEYDYAGASERRPTYDSKLFKDLGLDNLIDPNTEAYTKSLLQLLDELNQSQKADAMYRAFLALKLSAIADVRPAEWGLYWAPGMANYIQGLKNQGAGDIHSGDWLVPDVVLVYENRLKVFFGQEQANSLEKQAQFFQMLAHRTCAAGFAFAGFADANGILISNASTAAALETWGWGVGSSAPVLLQKRRGSEDPWETVNAPAPFSPVLVLGADRRALLQQVANATAYPLSAAKPYLPPLFWGIYE